MPIKVIGAEGSDDKTASKIDLFSGRDISPEAKDAAREEVGAFLVESILLTVADAKSPVKGESFPALSKEYKKIKVEEGGVDKPNMELTGNMLDSLTWRPTKEGIEVGFFGDEAAKADGHNKFSGRDNNAPKRRFLPGEDQEFKAQIMREADAIIADSATDSATLPKSRLDKVETKSDLYDLLRDRIGDFSSAELKAAIFRSPEMVDLLEEFDLLDLL